MASGHEKMIGSVRHTFLACAKSRHISVAVSTGSRWPAHGNSKWKHGIALAWGELATAGKSTIIRREVNDAA